MNQTSQQIPEELELLLSPISEKLPQGTDHTYSELFQIISETRRADNPALTQRGRDTPLKVADWGKVRELCEGGLLDNSKDLQLAAWYTEAMTHLEGFAGTAAGLLLTGELMRRFRETFHPNDPEERIGRLSWLNTQLGAALKQVPLTVSQHGGYNLYQWDESREVANLERSGGNDYDNAIKEGKLAPSTFEKSARESGAEFYRKLLDGLAEADVAQKELVRLIGEIFEEDAPGFSEVREALNACKNVVRRLYGLNGGILDEVAKTVEPLSDSSAEAQASANALPRPPKSAIGPVNSRGDAIRLLREISKYFREHEPHNPVPLLTERAAKWAEMPLEKWLKEVIKEDSTMKRLDEMLGFRPD